MLDLELPVNDRFELKPPVMAASRGAHESWRAYHDATEWELGKFGLYANVKDVGAKSAENAARLACSFQVWERGPGGELLPECMAAGVAVARWFLDDANRLLFEAQKPVELSDGELLSEWLTTVAPTPTRAGALVMVDGRLALGDILRLGPYRLRDKRRCDQALRLLSPKGMDDFHLRLEEQGRRKELMLNPNLLPRRPR